MTEQKLQRVIKASAVVVHPGRLAYLLNPKINKEDEFFLVTRDADEVTAIAEEKQLNKLSFEQVTRWFSLLEVRVSEPFVAKGFLAAITAAIAKQDLNVLVVSTYSKDYLLVRSETAEQAILALRKLGFPIKKK